MSILDFRNDNRQRIVANYSSDTTDASEYQVIQMCRRSLHATIRQFCIAIQYLYSQPVIRVRTS